MVRVTGLPLENGQTFLFLFAASLRQELLLETFSIVAMSFVLVLGGRSTNTCESGAIKTLDGSQFDSDLCGCNVPLPRSRLTAEAHVCGSMFD